MELSFRMNEAGLSKMGTDWLRQLKERLDSGEWLTHTPEGEPEGILTGVFVDQTRRIGLVYQQPGDDQYFQIFLNPDGTKADAFWSSRKNSEPEVYSEDEMSAIEQHIKNTFGEFENVFHELVSPDIHVDICVVPPSDERDYYTLVNPDKVPTESLLHSDFVPAILATVAGMRQNNSLKARCLVVLGNFYSCH